MKHTNCKLQIGMGGDPAHINMEALWNRNYLMKNKINANIGNFYEVQYFAKRMF